MSSAEVPSVALSDGGGEFPLLAAGDRVRVTGDPCGRVGEVVSVTSFGGIGWACVRWSGTVGWSPSCALQVVSHARA